MISQRYSVTGLPIDSYVVRMVNTSNVRMVGQVNDLDVTKVKQGQAADVYVDALPGKVLKGKVSFISPYGSGLYRLEISLDPADAQYLAQGQAAEADVLIDRHTGVLMVPNSAVMGKAGAYYVRVLVDQKANLVEQRPVATGLQNDSMTEIVSGIQESEKVVLQRAGPTSMPRK
jgi:HlyD family secretion protein